MSRSGVVERARASGSTVVSVAAPAGYGKSTMLAEWAASESRAVAWLSIDESDDDPAALLRLLATACSVVSSPVAAVVAEMRGGGGLALGRAAPMLAAALAATDAPFVLFVDDVHSAGSPDCRDVLEVVLGGVPAGSQVVLAGRHEQSYVARLRVEGAVAEISAADLRVDLQGARTIFREAGVAGVSDAGVAGAWERCEGWPAGLHLCALIARDGGGEPSAVSGDDRFVADYLYRECVERLPDDLQVFLRRTAVLDQLSAAVCDAVLGTTDSQLPLRSLEAQNLFLVPLDRKRGWYRYHALFREFLLSELQRVEADRIAELHLRAASWCEANGLPAHAIDHRLAAGDRERCVELVAETALQTYLIGEVGVVERWLAELGADAVESHPWLVVLACWKSLLLGETAEAERLAGVIEQLPSPDGVEDAVAFESARAMIRAVMCAGGAQRALAEATFGLVNEPLWSPWRDLAVYLYASTLLLVGDVSGARAAFADGAADANSGERTTDSVLLCEAELAILGIDDGDWPEARRHADTAVRMVDANHMEGYATSALAFAVGGRVALHDGDVAGAERLLAKGMRARALCTYVIPFVALRVRLQLAKAYAAKGERAIAVALTREMSHILRKRPGVGMLADEIAAFRQQLNRLPAGDGAAPLSPAELRVLPYLQTHLKLSEIGGRLIISRNTVSTQVRSIYLKLGVNTRGDAVRRATEMGLLGD